MTANPLTSPRQTLVYLAGFDVFRPDAIERGQQLRAWCAQAGFEGLYPLDAQVPAHLDGPHQAAWIYRSNLDAIHRADIVMANVDDFRGPGEPDSGTAFEIGYATALGKPVWAYTTDKGTLVERVPGHIPARVENPANPAKLCERGFVIENFGLSKNLMIACAVHLVQGDARACLAAMARAAAGKSRLNSEPSS